jgi:diguanylate cyclase (GGDEF)-like protein
VARVIRGCLRNVDSPARYGGDEFAIILPETTLGESAHVIDRMYERILAHSFEWKGLALSVGLSIGVSQYAGQKTAHDLISHVDDFLHHAKQAGKGRVSYDAKSNQPRTEATS